MPKVLYEGSALSPYEFWMNNITGKEFTKIFLHIQAHKDQLEKKMGKFKVLNSTDNGATLEFENGVLMTYLNITNRILISSHPKNHKNLKELFYHYMTCSCKMNEAVDKTNTLSEAIEMMHETRGG